MTLLTVRVYNVGFGDAVFITIPEGDGKRESMRHILIDMGNVLSGKGGGDEVFKEVAADIRTYLDRRPIDLYVMTHEHMDHVQGLKYLAEVGVTLPIDYAWLTASAAPDYDRQFPEAKKRLQAYHEQYRRLGLMVRSLKIENEPSIKNFLYINDHRKTSKCVDHLRNTAAVKTSYVYHGCQIQAGRDHPFSETTIRVLAPEQDTTTYYGRLRPLPVSDNGEGSPLAGLTPPKGGEGGESPLAGLEPPTGVDQKAFFNLIEHLQAGLGDNMLAIDRAANNTSVVLQIEWRGWRLLFPGDAELKSWRIMARQDQLQPVHFLKIAHHGSLNGTPGVDVLDHVLPQKPDDTRPRSAALSTFNKTYKGVPAESVIDLISSRVDKLYDTRHVKSGEAVEIPFPDIGE